MPTPSAQRVAALWSNSHSRTAKVDSRVHDQLQEDVTWDLEQVFRALSREAKNRHMKLDRWSGRFSYQDEEIHTKGSNLNVWMFSIPVRLHHEGQDFGVTIGVQNRDYKVQYEMAEDEVPDEYLEVDVEETRPGELYFAFSKWPSGVTYDDYPTKKTRAGIQWLLDSVEGARTRYRL